MSNKKWSHLLESETKRTPQTLKISAGDVLREKLTGALYIAVSPNFITTVVDKVRSHTLRPYPDRFEKTSISKDDALRSWEVSENSFNRIRARDVRKAADELKISARALPEEDPLDKALEDILYRQKRPIKPGEGAKIAKQLGVDRKTVYRRLKKMETQIRPERSPSAVAARKKKLTSYLPELRAFKGSYSLYLNRIQEIAKEVGMTQPKVQAFYKKHIPERYGK